jgi:hypothetical protein
MLVIAHSLLCHQALLAKMHQTFGTLLDDLPFMGPTIRGRLCNAVYAMVVHHSQTLAEQAYNEAKALLEDTGVTTLLCRKFDDNFPRGNSLDVKADRGHDTRKIQYCA